MKLQEEKIQSSFYKESNKFLRTRSNSYCRRDNVSQTVVRGPQVVLGFCPCGPLRLNISTKKTEKNKINVNCVSHTIVENLKAFGNYIQQASFTLKKIII
jgi:hypothetical protein